MTDTVTESELARFREVVEQRIGFRVHGSIHDLREILLGRLRATASPDVASYVDRFAGGSSEEAAIVCALVVGETFFLRGPEHFRVLASLLDERRRAGVNHLRVLSAGCSTGEELYSALMITREALGHDLQAWQVAFHGVDIDAGAVARARLGEYRRWSLRCVSDGFANRYLRQHGDVYQVIEPLRQQARFSVDNLLDPAASIWKAPPYDVVFCRNVLMYFVPGAARSVMDRLSRIIRPGGVLFLGHAENLRGLSEAYDLQQSQGAFFYRRHADDGRPLDPVRGVLEAQADVHTDVAPTTAWFTVIDKATRKIARVTETTSDLASDWTVADDETPAPPIAAPALDAALELAAEERFQEALACLEPISRIASPSIAKLIRASLLVALGERHEAERLCEGLIEDDELGADAHYVLGRCRESEADLFAARAEVRAATYLEPRFALAHLFLGMLARRVNDRHEVTRELRAAAVAMPDELDRRVKLFGGGFSRDALAVLCRNELAKSEVG